MHTILVDLFIPAFLESGLYVERKLKANWNYDPVVLFAHFCFIAFGWLDFYLCQIISPMSNLLLLLRRVQRWPSKSNVGSPQCPHWSSACRVWPQGCRALTVPQEPAWSWKTAIPVWSRSQTWTTPHASCLMPMTRWITHMPNNLLRRGSVIDTAGTEGLCPALLITSMLFPKIQMQQF